MGSTVSTEGESPQTRPADGVLRMSANAAAQMINHADNKLTRIEKHLSSHVDNGELLTASVARVALLEEKLTTLSTQIESLEEKLENVRTAAVELHTLKPLDANHVSTCILNELTQRLSVGSDPIATGIVQTRAQITPEQAAKIRRKRDL